MEQQTRMIKHAKLREMIAQDQEEVNYHDALAPFARKLSAIDEKYDVKDKVQSMDYIPNHAKEKAYQELFLDDSEDLISNDFLEQFIEEVKNYNLKAGTRHSSETTENVLHTFKQSPTSDEQSKQENAIKEDFRKSIHETFDTNKHTFDTKEDENEDHLLDDVLEMLDENGISLNFDNNQDDEEWQDKTQQLTTAMETLEDNFSDMSQKVLATNRLVNFLLAIFILGLLILAGYVVYMILGLQGIL